jgi:hypothetical protein
MSKESDSVSSWAQTYEHLWQFKMNYPVYKKFGSEWFKILLSAINKHFQRSQCRKLEVTHLFTCKAAPSNLGKSNPVFHYFLLLQVMNSIHKLACIFFFAQNCMREGWMWCCFLFSVFDCRKLLTRVLRSVTPRSFTSPLLRHLLSFTAWTWLAFLFLHGKLCVFCVTLY